MTTPWLIEARDPLIFRDGRPIGGNAPIETVDFPLPSTLAGAVRGRLASDDHGFMFRGRGMRCDAELDALRQIAVRGPLLAELTPTGDVQGWLFPAPRDVLVREDGPDLTLTPLRPRALAPGRQISGMAAAGLLPVAPLTAAPRNKPRAAPLHFWREAQTMAWLTGAPLPACTAAELGIAALPRESRMHLVMQPGQRVGLDGGLFETTGLRFTEVPTADDGPPRLSGVRQYALSVCCPGGEVGGRSLQLRREMAPLGGERRLARWSPAPHAHRWPDPPDALFAAIASTRRARVVLVTPALFAGGALPGWSGHSWPLGGPITATVRAACVPAPQIVSGWDMAGNRPKPTRRMAASGSVYFVELYGGDRSEIHAWITRSWLQCVSDEDTDRRDGFGLATIGVWNEETACP